MKRGDYYCEQCKNCEEDHTVKSGDLPDTAAFQCKDTPKKNYGVCILKRTFMKMPKTDVAEGIAGNKKTGYSTSVVYHPSELSPQSAIKAKREGDWSSIGNDERN